jgi:hypothetical protein
MRKATNMKKQHTSILILCCILMIGCGSMGQTADNDKAIEEQTQQAQDDSINQTSEPDHENESDVSTDVDEADEQQPEDATQSDEAKKTQEAEIEYEGLVFKINGKTYDLQELGSPANAIMDAKQVGDWVVVEGHVNPHVGVYHIVNLLTDKMEYTLLGAGLTWTGEDVTTGVYSMYDEIYDFEGNVIGKTDGAEISELSISEDGTEITAVDFDGNSFVFDKNGGGRKEESAAPTDVYSDILALYKKAQEGAYSQEQVEEIGLQTELLQDAWPWATSEDAVKYLFFDVDSDGKEELIITYYGEIKDIYGSDGKSHVYAYGCPYRGIASLYSNGMVEELLAATMQSASTTWYRYDPETGRYFPVFGTHYTPGKNEAEDATKFPFA